MKTTAAFRYCSCNMVASPLKEKYSNQTAELYRALGEFIVQFEHLMFATKNKINLLCGLGNETRLLLEPYTARQTIDLICKLIHEHSDRVKLDPQDQELFKKLVSDLRTINTERNRVVHTTWFIGWASEKETDFSEANGFKFSSQKNFKVHTVNSVLFDKLTERCKGLYKVMFTVWPIEIEPLRGPPLHTKFERGDDAKWKSK